MRMQCLFAITILESPARAKAIRPPRIAWRATETRSCRQGAFPPARGDRKSTEMQQMLRALGADPIGTTPREFASFLSLETGKTRKTIKASGIRP